MPNSLPTPPLLPPSLRRQALTCTALLGILRSADPISPPGLALVRPTVRIPRQACPRAGEQPDPRNPMHRETPPQTSATTASPAATRAVPVSTHRSAPAVSARKNPMHRGPAAPPAGPAAPLRTAPSPGPGGLLPGGNPRGNPNLAPRCGARTRSGCPCRAPAIRGRQRCRMHGGASTGPRTAAGLERLRAARTTHGLYAAPFRARTRFHITFLRRSRTLLALFKVRDWLPPNAHARLYAFPPELALPPCPPADARPSRAEDTAFAHSEAKALAPWKQAIAVAKALRRHQPVAPDLLQELDRLLAPSSAKRGTKPHAP